MTDTLPQALRFAHHFSGLLLGVLLLLSGAVQAAQANGGGAPAADAQARQAPLRYRIINLAPGFISQMPSINASGQVAFSVTDNGQNRAGFFDGRRVNAVGRPDWPINCAVAVNNAGQVAGFGGIDYNVTRAFRWSANGGLTELDSSGMSASVSAINQEGVVAGTAAYTLAPPHAFRWTPTGLRDDLGTLANQTTFAVAINDAGQIAGASQAANDDTHAFSWTRMQGIRDLGTLGGAYASAVAVDSAGAVAGYSMVAGASALYHAFLWTPAQGMRDLGAGGGTESFAFAMSSNGRIAGAINLSNGFQQGMTWTAASGTTDIGTLGGPSSRALGVNDKGQVAGMATDARGTWRAVLWQAGSGLTDLNRAVVNAPAGLLLDGATAVSNNGAVVATSNAGLVLLRPIGQEVSTAPVAGPVISADIVIPNRPLAVKVAFNDSEVNDTHRISWQWGDQTMEVGTVDERNGNGIASGRHRYRDPGIYTVIAQLSDRSGNTVTVTKDIVVAEPDQGVNARIHSPPGAQRGDPGHSGAAQLAFVAPASASSNASLSRSASLASAWPDARDRQAYSIDAQAGAAASTSTSAPDTGSATASATASDTASATASATAPANGAAPGGRLRFSTGTLHFVSERIRPESTGASLAAQRFTGSGRLNGRGGFQFLLTMPAAQASQLAHAEAGTDGGTADNGELASTASASGAAGTLAAGLRILHRDPAGHVVVDYDSQHGQ